MTDEDRQRLQEQALQKMIAHIEGAKSGYSSEKKMVLLIGMLVVALVATVGIAILLKEPKEQELERNRCEMEHSVAHAWQEMQAQKGANPGMSPRELQERVEAKRPSFKEAAKAECASK